MVSNPRLVLEAHGIFPKKKLGQNFLHDPNSLQKIIDIAGCGSIGDIDAGSWPRYGQSDRFAGGIRRAAWSAWKSTSGSFRYCANSWPNTETSRLHWMDILDADINSLVEGRPVQGRSKSALLHHQRHSAENVLEAENRPRKA